MNFTSAKWPLIFTFHYGLDIVLMIQIIWIDVEWSMRIFAPQLDFSNGLRQIEAQHVEESVFANDWCKVLLKYSILESEGFLEEIGCLRFHFQTQEAVVQIRPRFRAE